MPVKTAAFSFILQDSKSCVTVANIVLPYLVQEISKRSLIRNLQLICSYFIYSVSWIVCKFTSIEIFRVSNNYYEKCINCDNHPEFRQPGF